MALDEWRLQFLCEIRGDLAKGICLSRGADEAYLCMERIGRVICRCEKVPGSLVQGCCLGRVKNPRKGIRFGKQGVRVIRRGGKVRMWR